MKKVSKLLLIAGCLAFGVVAADGAAGDAETVPIDSEDGAELAEGSEVPQDGTKVDHTKTGGAATPSATSTSSTGTAAAATGTTTAAATTTAPVVVAATKAKNLPHMELLSPLKRKDVDMNRLAVKPCGGTKAGPVHYETTPGSRNMVAWKIHTAAPNGKCRISVSDSPKEKDMRVVMPTDGSADIDGSFPCGREVVNYEAKEIKIPRDIICDSCLIQLVWMTEDGDQYRCTDFESVATEVPECFGQCLNGGICRNGKCACPDGFNGSNCQYEDEVDEVGPSFLEVLLDDSVIIIVYALILALIIGLGIGAYRLYQKSKEGRVQVADSEKLTSNKNEKIGKSKFQDLVEDADD